MNDCDSSDRASEAPVEKSVGESAGLVPQCLFSTNLPELLERMPASLFATTYQAGRLMVARPLDGRISLLMRKFDQPMGMAIEPRRMLLGTRTEIIQFANAPDIAAQLEPAGRYDGCFVPRQRRITGDISSHELDWDAEDRPLVVNTRFSCLCTLDDAYSLRPTWQPPFVSKLAAEDRCHLNGLAMVDGKPKYVTALGQTDKAGGWREGKATGGVLVDVESGELVAHGLSMPHSPMVTGGRIWLLDSGTGRLVTVDRATGAVETVATLPGYARGLDIVGGLAFVGLSKIRETSTFGGIPIAERRNELKCGVWVVDLKSGETIAFAEFTSGVTEIFDVKLLRGVRFPEVVGCDQDMIRGIYIVPDSVGVDDG